MTTLPGIDVSAAGQGATFPWGIYRGKIAFAGVKISQATDYADPDAARNVAGCRSLGIPVIGYHFITTAEPGAAQAAWFLAHAAAAGMRPGDLLAFDTEQAGGPAPQLWTVSAGFALAVHDHYGGSFWPLAYTDISLAAVAPASVAACPLWLATLGEQVPAMGPWRQIAMEQVGQRGVDTDVFHGTPQQLAALAIPERKPVVPPSPSVTQARALITQMQDALTALARLLG